MIDRPTDRSAAGAVLHTRHSGTSVVQQGAQHKRAGSTPTDQRYVAACGQVKPAIPIVIHRPVDRIVGTRSVTGRHAVVRMVTDRDPPNTTTLRRLPDTPDVSPKLLFIACG